MAVTLVWTPTSLSLPLGGLAGSASKRLRKRRQLRQRPLLHRCHRKVRSSITPVQFLGTETFTEGACYIKVLEIDPSHAEAWINLGFIGGGHVGTETFTEAACYIKALEIDPSHAEAWINLGFVGCGHVGTETFTEGVGYIKALEIDPSHAGAWLNLGFLGGGHVIIQIYVRINVDHLPLRD